MTRVLVLGLGDILNGDMGVGMYALKELLMDSWPSWVDFASRYSLINDSCVLNLYDYLLVLDAIQVGNNPGTMHKFYLDDLNARKSCLRDVYFLNALTLSELSSRKHKVLFLGVEPEEKSWQFSLSSPVQKVYPDYVQCAKNELNWMLAEIGNE